MKKLFLIIVFALSLSNAFAQARHGAVRTSVDNGRYEIVQSEMARRLIFMLDKYTGDVYQNLLSSKDEMVWRKLGKVGSSNDIAPKTQINYQLFMGGFSVKDILLLNINTGETWYLYQDTETEKFFFSKSFGDSDI